MTRILVWDIPTRLFHWLLAGAFLPAFLIAVVVEDEGRLFAVHMLLGLVAAVVVLLRLLWGLVGSRPSRLSALELNPAALLAYARDAVAGGARRNWPAHNPGASWAAVSIFAGVLGLGVTGILMSRGSEAAEELHGALAWTTMAAVVAHLAGIALHTFREREPIALSMVDGRRVGPAGDAIPSARPLLGLAALAAVGAWTGGLVLSYDSSTRTVTLPLVGAQLALGEGAGGGEHEEEGVEDDD
jgi:cytochrome b